MIEVFTGDSVWPNLTPVQIICQVVAKNALPNTSEVTLPYIQALCKECTSSVVAERPSAELVLLTMIKNAPHIAARLVCHAYNYTS